METIVLPTTITKVPASTRGISKHCHSLKNIEESAKATRAFELVNGAITGTGTFNTEIAYAMASIAIDQTSPIAIAETLALTPATQPPSAIKPNSPTKK